MFSGNEWVILVVVAGVLAIPVLVVLAIVGGASRRTGTGAQPASGPAAVQMPGAPPPGWFPDPTGRNEQRYWDGRAWTDAVVSNGQPGTDPI